MLGKQAAGSEAVCWPGGPGSDTNMPWRLGRMQLARGSCPWVLCPLMQVAQGDTADAPGGLPRGKAHY